MNSALWKARLRGLESTKFLCLFLLFLGATCP